jgi:pyrroline-5-carboxylate reductase
LREQFDVQMLESASSALAGVAMVVWAVNPQAFHEAATAVAPYTSHALHLSVAAGIRTNSMAQWLGTEYIVRSMPNTPALVGSGMTGLFTRPSVSDVQKLLVERVIGATGQFLWVQREEQLDAVTALSGSGPAYVFYFLEAMAHAGTDMGLPPAQAYQLAVATFVGASHVAAHSSEQPAVLRERVTSKGGTTHATRRSRQGTRCGVARIRPSDSRSLESRRERFGAARQQSEIGTDCDELKALADPALNTTGIAGGDDARRLASLPDARDRCIDHGGDLGVPRLAGKARPLNGRIGRLHALPPVLGQQRAREMLKVGAVHAWPLSCRRSAHRWVQSSAFMIGRVERVIGRPAALKPSVRHFLARQHRAARHLAKMQAPA